MIEWMVVGLLIFGSWPYPSGWHVSGWLLSGETYSFDERVRSLGCPHPSYTYNAETFPTSVRCQKLARGGVHQPN